MSEYTENKSERSQAIDKLATITAGMQTDVTPVVPEDTEVDKSLKTITDFYNRPLHDHQDLKVKKLYAASLAIAAEKGYIPKMQPETVATVAQMAATSSKAIGQYATNKIDQDTMVEAISDCGTVAITTIAKRKLTSSVIAKGLNFCVNAISCVFPPARVLGKFVAPLAKWAVPVVKVAIHKVAPVVKKAIKSTVNFAVSGLKKVGSWIASGIKSVVGAIASFFGF